MRVQKESKAVKLLAIALLVGIFSLRCFANNIVLEPDATFLYNRCYQMWDCVKHGFYPFLYYNDLGGIGYGSPIFYGQLSLVPFIPFLFDIAVFLKVYFLCSLLLNFFAFRACAKRFSSYGTLSACIYVLGMPFMYLYAGSGLYAGTMATGFSWLFFAFCVDYFRDGKNFALVILSYFMIWQCNFNSVVLATVACFALFVVYFSLERWKDYARLLIAVAMTIGYNVVNILVHLDALRLTDGALLFPDDMSLPDVVFSSYPFGGYMFRMIANSSEWPFADTCGGFMQFGILAVVVFFLVSGFRSQSRRYKVCTAIVLVSVVVGYVIGEHHVWYYVYNATNLFIQFPLRYQVLLWGSLAIVLSRVVQPRRWAVALLALCLVDILVTNPVRVHTPVGGVDHEISYQLCNGEYLGETFVQDWGVYEGYRSSVHSESGVSYSWQNDYNGVSVDCSSNTGSDVLTLPKLYYRGYCSEGEAGEVFEVTPGYSNYCEVAIGDYTGTLRLYYCVPSLVMAFFWLQVACVLASLWHFVFVEPDMLERRRYMLSFFAGRRA